MPDMVRVRVLLQVGVGAVLAGCSAAADEPTEPRPDAATEARGLAAEACGMVTPHPAVDDIGAQAMRDLAHAYGDAVHPLVGAVVRDPGNADYPDLMSAMGMAEAGWENAAELVETHGRGAAAWDAQSTGEFDRLVTRLLGYERAIDDVCQSYR
jgi:hypothetical protein